MPCLCSLSGRTSYREISWVLEAARFGFKLFQSLWLLTGTSVTVLPQCLSHFRAIQSSQHPVSRLRDFTKCCSKMPARLVNRGPVQYAEYAALENHVHSCCCFTRYGDVENVTLVIGGIVFSPEASFGLRVLSSPMSVYLSVCVCACQSLTCPHDNSSTIRARITKFET